MIAVNCAAIISFVFVKIYANCNDIKTSYGVTMDGQVISIVIVSLFVKYFKSPNFIVFINNAIVYGKLGILISAYYCSSVVFWSYFCVFAVLFFVSKPKRFTGLHKMREIDFLRFQ